MTQVFLTFLIFIFGTATFLAADKTSQKPADNKKEESAEKEKDEKKIPIRITSDKMKYHENGFIVFFTGNVNVDDGEMKLNCDFMTVNLDKTRNPVKSSAKKMLSFVNRTRLHTQTALNTTFLKRKSH